MNLTALQAWLRQPSTWKAIIILIGVFGVSVSPERVGEILTAAATVYAGIAAFWDSH